MSDPALGLLMLCLIIVVIVMGFPTAFTLMGLGIVFGYIAFYNPAQLFLDNRVFELMVQRTYGAMTNDVLISVPLFVLMGYVMERGALVDKMFYAIQLAFRNVPASLAVATLIVCTFWGIASGLVGAVVVLMGVIALNPMLRAGYDVKLASGVITAGGTLGILIPPSVMIIVYAAVAGQSVVKLYAAAMFPGFFLALLYLVYIIGWALLNPKVAPRLPEEQTRVPVPDWVRKFQAAYSNNVFVSLVSALFSPGRAKAIDTGKGTLSYGQIVKDFLISLVPFVIVAGTLWLVWWYVVIHQQVGPDVVVEGVEQLGSPVGPREATDAEKGPPTAFYYGYAVAVVLGLIYIARYYLRMTAERFEVLKLLSSSIMPLATLTVIVLGVILFGITTATEFGRRGRARRFPLGDPGAHARLEAHQASRVPHRQDHRDGVLAVRRLGGVLRCVRDPRRSGAGREVGSLDEPDAAPVHDPVADGHLHPRLAARMDRDHRHLRADLPAAAQVLRHRPHSLGRAGVREPAGRVPLSTGRDVGVLPKRGGAKTRHHQPDIRRHDAVHADRHRLHGVHVYLARHDVVAAEFPVREVRLLASWGAASSARSRLPLPWGEVDARSAAGEGILPDERP